MTDSLRDEIVLKVSNLLYAGKSLHEISKIPKKELEKWEGVIDELMELISSATKEAYEHGKNDAYETAGEDMAAVKAEAYRTGALAELKHLEDVGMAIAILSDTSYEQLSEAYDNRIQVRIAELEGQES